MVTLCGAAFAQRHIEFRWHGIYVAGDASVGFNINRSVDELTEFGDTLTAFIPSVSVGYSFRKEAAVGIGFSYVADGSGAYTQLPVYAELRSHFTRAQLTPYGVMQVGYSLPLGTSSVADPVSVKIEEGGLYFGLEAGVRYALTRHIGIAGHAGYRLLQANKVHRRDVAGHSLLETPANLHMITFGATLYFSN